MLKRLWVIGLVTLTALVSTAVPARAATGDVAAANRAGAWLATQLVDGHLPGADAGAEYGNTLTGLVGLAATNDPALRPSIEAMTAYLAPLGATQGKGSARAALLAIAEDALGLAPRTLGVDTRAAIMADTAADGSIGSWANAYSQGMAMVGLVRAGGAPTDAQVAWLVGQQDPSGAFGYADWTTGAFVADPDSTSLAVLGLATSGRPDAAAAADRAAAWLRSTQQADGSWAAWSPVNTTALAGMALASRGDDTSKALAWVKKQQDAAGGLLFDGTPDVYATSQALVFLGGTSYRTVTWRPVAAAPAPQPVPTATATTTVTAPAAPRPTATVRTTTTTTRTRVVPAPAPTVTVTVTTTATPEALQTPPTTAATPSAAPSATTTSVAPTRATAPAPAAQPAANPDLPLYVGGGAMLALAAGGATWLLRRR